MGQLPPPPPILDTPIQNTFTVSCEIIPIGIFRGVVPPPPPPKVSPSYTYDLYTLPVAV